jgi:hypothetical protein
MNNIKVFPGIETRSSSLKLVTLLTELSGTHLKRVTLPWRWDCHCDRVKRYFNTAVTFQLRHEQPQMKISAVKQKFNKGNEI